MPPHYVGEGAEVVSSMVTEGCEVYGCVKGSVLYNGVIVEKGAVVEDSVIMPGNRICAGAVVRRAIVAENTVISAGCVVGEENGDIALVGSNTTLPEGYKVAPGAQVDTDSIAEEAKA